MQFFAKLNVKSELSIFLKNKKASKRAHFKFETFKPKINLREVT